MGSNSGRSQLGQNQGSVTDNLFKVRFFDTADKFIRPESPFARRAPDIDCRRIQHNNPCLPAGQGFPEGIKTQGIVGRDKDRRIGCGIRQGIKAGFNPMSLPPETPARQPVVESVSPGNEARRFADQVKPP